MWDDLDEFERKVASMIQRLHTDHRLAFLLTVKPGKQATSLLRSDLEIGPLQGNLSLHPLSGQVYPPLEWDFVLYQRLSASSGTLQGYVQEGSI